MELFPVAAVRRGTRKEQAFAFICEFIVAQGYSPGMLDIAVGLQVCKTRARQLVEQLTIDGLVQRLPGAQRAIFVPGLARRIAIEQLRKEGFVVDEDVLKIEPPDLPKAQLPLVAIIDHDPDHDDESSE
ncbi:hypothetical protein [Sphingomonas sp. IW22]|uniref:hypothetical protein n=1 Tax=Sphingomonas sp. IW22 TaxID=3242489 RepID=UPI003522868A